MLKSYLCLSLGVLLPYLSAANSSLESGRLPQGSWRLVYFDAAQYTEDWTEYVRPSIYVALLDNRSFSYSWEDEDQCTGYQFSISPNFQFPLDPIRHDIYPRTKSKTQLLITGSYRKRVDIHQSISAAIEAHLWSGGPVVPVSIAQRDWALNVLEVSLSFEYIPFEEF